MTRPGRTGRRRRSGEPVPFSEVRALADALQGAEAALRQEQDRHWADKVAACADIVDRGDLYGAHRFLGLFGGMGSLTDTAGEHSQPILDRAWTLARKLARESR
jgi:hypothetical protein